MKGLAVGVLSVSLVLGLGAGAAQAQKWTGTVPLGDLARQLKAQRAKSAKQPRMYTNDDLIALRTKSELSSSSAVRPSASAATEASAVDGTNHQAGAKLAVKNSAIPIEWGKETLGDDYIDRMSKVQVAGELPRKDASNSPSVAKLGQGSSPQGEPAGVPIGVSAQQEPIVGWAKTRFRISAEAVQQAGKDAGHVDPAPSVQGTQEEVSAPGGEWAKAKFRAAQGAHFASGEPGPIPAPELNSQAAQRRDLGYVERADGKVEAIVAQGEHIGLIEETKEFMKNFHIPAPSPTELEVALASPYPNPPETAAPEADQQAQAASSSAAGQRATEGTTDVAQLQQPQAPPADNAQSQSEASLEAEPLAEYTGDRSRPKPHENLEPANGPAFVTARPDVIANRSSVTPVGYVEKAGGEKEAIVEFQNEVFLVHEGELFAGKYRVLRLTAVAVEIVEEPTAAPSAAIDRRRYGQVVPESR